jgi:ammonium transporter, Amt family
MVFVPVWAIVVYSVVAQWVWPQGGCLFKLGVLDYAGGLVVEIVSGSSASWSAWWRGSSACS